MSHPQPLTNVATITWILEEEDGAPISLHTHGVLRPARDWQAEA
ncbi:MAG: hypothetical protein ACKVK8_05310 [Rhodospirillales bacterium]